jgi:hypothetical protein
MQYLLLIAILIIPTLSHAQVGSVASTCIWSGTLADCLPSDGILLRNQRDVRFGEATGSGSNYVAIQAPTTLAGDITLTLPVDDGDANEFLQTNGSGAMSWEPVDLATDVTGILPLANGGTNKNATAVNGGLVWSDADSLEITTAGTAQQWVLSGGAGAPTMSNTTTTEKTIDGTADAVQLTVQGHSTQTNDVLVVETSAGTDIMSNAATNRKTTFGGPIVLASENRTATGTLGSAAQVLYWTGSASGQTVTLPANSDLSLGQLLFATNQGTNSVLIAAGAGSTIQGGASISLGVNTTRAWVYVNTNWEIYAEQ